MVSSDFPALREVVEACGLGCTFDPEEPESIAAAIDRVLADAQRSDTMKKNALAAARMFNWETESAKLLQVCRRLSRRALMLEAFKKRLAELRLLLAARFPPLASPDGLGPARCNTPRTASAGWR